MEMYKGSYMVCLKKKIFYEPAYSVRRYFVDEFYLRNINLLVKGSKVIDIGGKRNNKRGCFDIEKYGFEVKYVNSDVSTKPDYMCDAAAIPVVDACFDGAIISELLEHVIDPKKVLKETYRILKPQGRALICTPFVYNIHPDPYDFGRYTADYLRTVLCEIGFKNISIEKQGLFFSVLAGMFKQWAGEKTSGSRIGLFCKRKALFLLFRFFMSKAVKLENRKIYQNNPVFSGYCTGFGIICEK